MYLYNLNTNKAYVTLEKMITDRLILSKKIIKLIKIEGDKKIMKTRLYRNSSWNKTLSLLVGDKEFKICSFVFYNENGIVCKREYGYLENDFCPEFNFEVVKKIKESFNKKIAYIIKSKKDYDRGYDLYIHEDLVELQKPTFKIERNYIVAHYYTNIEGLNFEIYEKSLESNLFKIKKDIEIETKKLTDCGLKSDDMSEIIIRLQELQHQLKNEEDLIASYTIDEYISKEVI